MVAGVLMSVLTLLGLEVLARAVPGPWQPTMTPVGYIFDPDVGMWVEPGPRDVDLPTRSLTGWHVNAYGMQDIERELTAPPGKCRVAVLGDSFMEGHSVGLGRLSNVLEGLLGEGYEVMNFGMSSLGTTQEVAVFRHKAAQFSPDITILGFFAGNDVRNNSREIERASAYTFLDPAGYYTVDAGGELTLHPPQMTRGTSLKSRVFAGLKASYLFRAAHYLRQQRRLSVVTDEDVAGQSVADAGDQAPGLFGQPWPSPFVEYGVYLPPRHRAWEDAWTITERALGDLLEANREIGAELIVLMVTSDVQLVPDPRRYTEEQVGVEPPEGFDPGYPNERVCSWADSNQVMCVDMLPVLEAYRDLEGLEAPYFWFEDDGHWNALAHRLAAEELADSLRAGEPSTCHPLSSEN